MGKSTDIVYDPGATAQTVANLNSGNQQLTQLDMPDYTPPTPAPKPNLYGENNYSHEDDSYDLGGLPEVGITATAKKSNAWLYAILAAVGVYLVTKK